MLPVRCAPPRALALAALALALALAAAPALAAAEMEGTASWYGVPFHGRTTSSGEVFDKEKLTAAHKTLPFGTLLKVTNLGNGKAVVVRVTDRGPFVKDRIIDLSEAAARAIGMIGTGTARVRLEIVPPGTTAATPATAPAGAAPSAPATPAANPPALSPPPAPGPAATPDGVLLQVASFGSRDRAEAVAAAAGALLGRETSVEEAVSAGRRLYRVLARLSGTLAAPGAIAMLDEAGYPGAFVRK